MGATSPRHLVLDAGALIAMERRDRRLLRALELTDAFHVPAGVLAQVWRDPSRQVALTRFMAGESTTVHELTVDVAKAAGRICGQARTADVIDASVVIVAREVGGVVITSDPLDIARLAPDLPIEAI